ncbi:PALE CRESS protein [Sesbania bispinosa]|nr:PALE CRESS protein [Sesbania bispinosa]
MKLLAPTSNSLLFLSVPVYFPSLAVTRIPASPFSSYKCTVISRCVNKEKEEEVLLEGMPPHYYDDPILLTILAEYV